jgi:hypothetical protein
MLWVTPKEKARAGRKAGAYSLSVIQWRDSRCTMVLTAWDPSEKSRYDLARMEPRAADSLVAGISSTRRPAQLTIPTDTRTSFRVFRNYRLRWQLVAFQKRFRPLELPPPEIRPEFDRHTSNAGMLQSGMPHLARFQEFHRLSMRRHRVLLRQSEGLKRKIPGPSRASLLWLIFSPVAFVFSS